MWKSNVRRASSEIQSHKSNMKADLRPTKYIANHIRAAELYYLEDNSSLIHSLLDIMNILQEKMMQDKGSFLMKY